MQHGSRADNVTFVGLGVGDGVAAEVVAVYQMLPCYHRE